MQKNYLKKIKSFIIFFSILSFIVYEMALQVSPGAMAEPMMKTLNISSLTLGFISGIYFYTYAATQTFAGLLYDRIHLRYIVPIALLVCVVGSYIFYSSSSVVILSFARLCMGAGSAFAFVGGLKSSSDLFAERYYPFLLGITQTLAAIGAMMGTLPVAMLVSRFGWQDTMLIFSAVGLIIALFVFSIANYEKKSISSSATDLKGKNAVTKSILHDLKIVFKNPQTWLLAAYASTSWAPMIGFGGLWGIPFLQTSYSLSSEQASLLCAFLWMGLAVASLASTFLLKIFRHKKYLLFTLSFFNLLCISAVIFLSGIPLPILAILLFISGVMSSGQLLSFVLVKNNNPNHCLGVASGFNNMGIVSAGLFLQPITGWIIFYSSQHFHSAGDGIYLAADYRYGLAIIPVLLFLGIIISKFLTDEKQK